MTASSDPVLVVGATGQLGGRVVDHLLARGVFEKLPLRPRTMDASWRPSEAFTSFSRGYLATTEYTRIRKPAKVTMASNMCDWLMDQPRP